MGSQTGYHKRTLQVPVCRGLKSSLSAVTAAISLLSLLTGAVNGSRGFFLLTRLGEWRPCSASQPPSPLPSPPGSPCGLAAPALLYCARECSCWSQNMLPAPLQGHYLWLNALPDPPPLNYKPLCLHALSQVQPFQGLYFHVFYGRAGSVGYIGSVHTLGFFFF